MESVYGETFSERMDRGRDRADRERERLAYQGRYTVLDLPPVRWIGVKDLAEELGVGEHRVRQFLRRGAVEKARRVKGEWRIPSVLGRDGKYRVRVIAGKRGPRTAYSVEDEFTKALSPGEVPF